MTEGNSCISRRGLIGAASVVSAGIATLSAPPAEASRSRNVETLRRPAHDRVKFGIIGVGMRGSELLRLTLAIDGAEIAALCDIDEVALHRAAQMITESRRPAPALYTGAPDTAYRRLVDDPNVQAVMIVTPWEWHLPMALDAMNAGKDTFVEVPAALTVDDCWRLVDASERNQVHCMMMENCCYDRAELIVLNMVRAGLLGEITHAEGAYIHNLRWLLDDMTKGEGSWRPYWYTRRIGNAYPTHGLGPIAQYMSINRGDRFNRIVSMSSPARSFAQYATERYPSDTSKTGLRFTLGDVNTSIIQTARGRTIMLQHDVSTPRPYSRINLVQGTKGMFAGYPDRIALDSHGGGEAWIEDSAALFGQYKHEFWGEFEASAAALGGGHGGMDYIMLWRMVHCLRNGLPVDQNVYDAAAWSVVFDLSERSARNGGRPYEFPDFTRGVWRSAQPRILSLQPV